MEYHFTSCLAPVLVESSPLDDFWLECVVGLRYEFPGEHLQDGSRVYAMREEIVERCADLEKASWTSFLDDLVGDLCDERFPIWWGDVRCFCDVFAVCMSAIVC